MPRPADYEAMLDELRRFPARLEAAVRPLSGVDRQRKPLANEWTINQIVHHCADSHMNSFIRLKLILTEERPLLKSYEQDVWVTMADEDRAPIEPSLAILGGLHVRWVALCGSLAAADWDRVGIHTADGEYTPASLLHVYATHCREHLEQIARVRAAL